jgi:hypothetical protein
MSSVWFEDKIPSQILARPAQMTCSKCLCVAGPTPLIVFACRAMKSALHAPLVPDLHARVH